MLPISHQRKLQRETEKREENTIARLSACDSSLFIARNSIVATMQVPRKKKENTSANSTKRLLNTLLRSRERKKIAHVNKHVLNTITLPFLLHNSINTLCTYYRAKTCLYHSRQIVLRVKQTIILLW